MVQLSSFAVSSVSVLLLSLAIGEARWAGEPSMLRSSSTDAGDSEQPPRLSVSRRLYGPENAHVRRNVRELEQRLERSRTGLPGDPNHKVPYENHPYDHTNRKLQNETSSPRMTSDNFKPLRIQFFTDALDNQRTADNAAKIDFIKREILPRTADFWSQALSVVPVSGNLLVSTAELEGREYCGDSEFTMVPSEHITTGVADTDLILYVSGTPSSRFCSGTTLAVAVSCNYDQYDRPTAGSINVCLDQIELNDDGTASAAIADDNVDVLIHEVAHVLGHSSNSYLMFWDPETGTPRTPRPFETKTVLCVDDVERTIAVPAENTIKFSQAANGQRYASIVTPKVRTIARNQFDCQSLVGAKLEDQPTDSSSCYGDHWDEHDFFPEMLSGVVSSTTNVLSHLTLALMEDSGWYLANYTQGKMNPWGLGAGCDFVEKPCLKIDDSGEPYLPDYSKGYFCLDESARGCSQGLTHKQACSVLDYFYIVPRVLPIDRFQYFPNEPTKGGPKTADYCPIFGSAYGGLSPEQLACTDTKNADTLNIYSEVYGEDSQCIPTESGDGRCYRTACVKNEMVLKINVRGEWLTCESDFQKLEVRVGSGAVPQTLVCPRLSTACPDLFCPFSCAGRGTCIYNNTVNGTIWPKCECFDPDDTSPGCSDSILPDGVFLENSDGLINNVEEDFFDPLIAVFVDHPDNWTSSSWAWAAGLMTILLIMMLCICSAFWPAPPQGKSSATNGTPEREGSRPDSGALQTQTGSSGRRSSSVGRSPTSSQPRSLPSGTSTSPAGHGTRRPDPTATEF